jgi:ATP-dependent DNA helicase DinG
MTIWSSVSVPSTFPPERRPIYIHPVAKMSNKEKDHAYPIIADTLCKIIALHNTDKILVHTVSYALNQYLVTHLSESPHSHRIVTYHSATEKQRAIDEYLYSEAPVLLAPSLDRGIDLPGDDCRCIVVCKIPFPSLGDKQISTRLHSRGGQSWYSVRTIRSLVQMTGRGMRSHDDFCESYILDAQFIEMIWRKSKHLLPEWWKEALVWNRGTL